MWIFSSITFALVTGIAGILSSIDAQEDLKSLCTKNGNATAYNDIRSGRVRIESCMAEAQRSKGNSYGYHHLNICEYSVTLESASTGILISDLSALGTNEPDILTRLDAKFDGQHCGRIQRVEECSIKLLAECEDKTFSEILDSLWKHINDNIPCNNLTKSAGSPAGAVNTLLLLIAVVAMPL